MKKIFTIVLCCIMSFALLSGCTAKENEASINIDLGHIKEICELITLRCYYNNVAVGKKEAGKGLTHTGEKSRKFWLEYTGYVEIGIDMEKVDLSMEGEKIKIHIPEAKVIEVDIDEWKTENNIYSKDGINKNLITPKEEQNAINTSQEKMKESANKDKALLKIAQDKAKEAISNYVLNIAKQMGVEYTIEWI